MNKPAAKEPSMDEILSSIRQIIADDDATASTGPKMPLPSFEPEPEPELIPSFDAFLAEEEDKPEPEPLPEPEHEDEDEALALSLDQVIEEPAIEPPAAPPEPEPAMDEVAGKPDYSSPDDIAFVGEDLAEPPQLPPDPRAGRTMPDPRLSADLADHLLADTARAAASHAFSRLGNFSVGMQGQTVEGVVRELLKPMLKAWLDENLPSVVERLVEREIERVARGGR